MCAAKGLAFRDHLLGRLHHRDPPTASDRGPVGVMPRGEVLGVAVQHLDVVERDAELVGDDLAPRRLMALTVW